ncbi:hypothetical protein [Ideonella sp. A 288]|uniref:hypothetical protein n=1 Tax=Ideonella sp. A 288 TaxID=1962181 RepID=UPI000B4B24F2|nr:hypothetical protein [Ideonella sp. A 288]
MATIYRKTDKGRSEIETRANRLEPRLRSTLILVDGRHSDEQLAGMVSRFDGVLERLAGEGYIEPVAPAPPPPRPIAEGPRPGGSVAERRRAAVRILTDAVGPAGEDLAMRIERAEDEMTLRPLLVMARDSIRNVRGADAAASFESRFLT